MAQYSERDLQDAAEFREGVHREALAELQKIDSTIREVVDVWPVEAYFEDVWDYPGRWYTYVAVPPEARGRKNLIKAIIRDTLAQRSRNQQTSGKTKVSDVVYRDNHYTLGWKDGLPYLRADGKMYWLSCSPHEPCLYITAPDGDRMELHYAFDPSDVLRDFARGRTVTSITGREYSPRDFCALVASAAGPGSLSIRDAEWIFRDEPVKKAAVPESPETSKPEAPSSSAPVQAGPPAPDEPERPEAKPFQILYADFPDAAADIYIVKDVQPCRGLASHRRALAAACRALSAPDEDGFVWRFDAERAQGRPVSSDAPFLCLPRDGGCNLRKAVLDPPHGSHYDTSDFDALCAALFPKGRARLEVFEWSTDWSDWFDDGHEWWGAMCCTVYDRSMDRYAVLLASATD